MKITWKLEATLMLSRLFWGAHEEFLRRGVNLFIWSLFAKQDHENEKTLVRMSPMFPKVCQRCFYFYDNQEEGLQLLNSVIYWCIQMISFWDTAEK